MGIIGTKEAARKWNISQRRVLALCENNRIKNLNRVGHTWLIPCDAPKPMDNRRSRYLDTSDIAKPFLKWAGGKTQLLKEIDKKISAFSKFDKYAEPFVGGGAVLFHVLERYHIKQAYISDINSNLVNSYLIIKKLPKELINLLEAIETAFLSKDTEGRREYYYNKRDLFNEIPLNSTKNKLNKAALFIFLNKTCFNGLYRVNKKGEFNVPIGAYKNPLICDKENIYKVSNLLQNVEIICADYSESIHFIDKKTMVYFDPPYRPLNKTSSFTSYTSEAFDDKAQIKLADYIKKVHKMNAKIILSNSDPSNIDSKDYFFDKLYSPFNIKRVFAARMINCKQKARGKIKELLITNF